MKESENHSQDTYRPKKERFGQIRIEKAESNVQKCIDRIRILLNGEDGNLGKATDRSLIEYMCEIYTFFPRYIREQIIFKPKFDIINKAIDQKISLEFSYNGEHHIIDPYILCKSLDEQSVFLIGLINGEKKLYKTLLIDNVIMAGSSFDCNNDLKDEMKQQAEINPLSVVEISNQYTTVRSHKDAPQNIHTKNYTDFAVQVFKKMYSIKKNDAGAFVSYSGQFFPDTCIYASSDVRQFDVKNLSFHEGVFNFLGERKTPDSDELEKRRVHYAYRCTQVHDNLYGYMCDKIKLNERNELIGIDFTVGRAFDNLVSTLTLREDFENEYNDVQGDSSKYTLNEHGWRAYLHKLMMSKEKKAKLIYPIQNLFSGDSRYNQMGIQVIMLFKYKDPMRRYSDYSDGYWTPYVQRDDNVIEQPGFYQLTPCGNFQIFEPPTRAANADVQKENFNIFSYILYLICRELYNDQEEAAEFLDSYYDRPSNKQKNMVKIRQNTHSQEIISLLEKSQASVEFLGLSCNYTGLKSDMVFLLKIDDPNYQDGKNFRTSYELNQLDFVPIDLLNEETCFDNPVLAEGIAPCLALLRKSKHAKDIFQKSKL